MYTKSEILNFTIGSRTIKEWLSVFNGASQLVQMDATGKLPAIDGSQLTNLPSSGGSGSPVGTASGTNTYTVSCTPTVTALTTNLCVRILFTNGNTGASTLNVDGLGAKNLVVVSSALLAGDILAGSIIECYYDGTNFQIGKVGNWWNWLKTQVQNISNTWSFTKGVFGTTTAGNAQVTTAAPTSSLANQIDTPGVAYTGTDAGARWNETTNNRVRGYLGSAFDYIKSVGNYLFQNSNSLNALVSAGSTGDISVVQVQAAFTHYPTATSYVISLTDIYFGSIIGVTSTSAARTITLPAANSVPAGFLITIVDESNGAATNNISFALTGSDTTNVTTISTNGGFRKVYSDGTSKWFSI